MRIFRDLIATAVVTLAFVGLLEVGMRLAGVRYEYSFYESDPVIYTAVTALVLLVALGATLVPARRATKVDPMVALRTE